jgi:predicted transposase YbfD/YdcC
LAAVKGNQPKLYQAVQEQFVAQQTYSKVNKGHERIENRRVSTMESHLNLSGWLNLQTIIKVESQRQTRHKIESETRYYISDLNETALSFYRRIRGYWGVENKVHYVRDVTFGEDRSRIRTFPLPQISAIARNLAINLYRNVGFSNMAQARRKCQFDLDHVLSLFRMK